MKAFPLLALSLICLPEASLHAQSAFSPAAAQPAIRSRPPLPRLPQAGHPFEEQQQAAAKPSGAPRFREIAQSAWTVQNGARRISDSLVFGYGNGRGSQKINWPENFDEALEYFNNGPGLTTVSLNYRYRCSYNGANQLTEFLEEFIDQGSSWIGSESRKYTYDAAGNMLRYLNMDYQNGGLRNRFLYDWTYDAAGRLASEEFSLWFSNSTAWEKRQRKTYGYTSTGRPDTTFTWGWNGQSWNKGGREWHTYDNGGRVTEDINEQLAGTAWHQVDKTRYHYNAAGLPDTVEYYGSSSPYQRYIYGYSPSGKMVLSLYQEINAGWKDRAQEIWSFDAQDDSISHEYQQWSTATNGWTSSLTLQYTYNSNHQVLSLIQQNLRTLYEYNSDALLETVKYAFRQQNSWSESSDAHYYYESYQPTAAGSLQAEKPAALLAWPNPSGGAIRVTGRTLPGRAELQVVDAQGRLLLRHPFRSDGFVNEQIDLGTLPEGTYQLLLRDAAGRSATGISIVK